MDDITTALAACTRWFRWLTLSQPRVAKAHQQGRGQELQPEAGSQQANSGAAVFEVRVFQAERSPRRRPLKLHRLYGT